MGVHTGTILRFWHCSWHNPTFRQLDAGQRKRVAVRRSRPENGPIDKRWATRGMSSYARSGQSQHRRQIVKVDQFAQPTTQERLPGDVDATRRVYVDSLWAVRQP